MPDDPSDDAPRPCSPCRGTGQVLSKLGGTEQTLSCPWCEGGGTFLAEHDAQAVRSA